jgi:hypothetical protein
VRRRHLIFVLGAALSAGCGDGGGGPGDAGGGGQPAVCNSALCPAGRVGTLELGEGIADEARPGVLVFRPLADGDEVAIIPGFQGGQHIWVILRATDIETCYVTPRYELIDPGGNLLDATWGGEFYPVSGEPGVFEFFAYPAFVSHPQRVHRREVALRAAVSDGCGNLIADEVRVVPVDARLP